MGLSLPKSNLIFLKKCLDKWVHFTIYVKELPLLDHMSLATYHKYFLKTMGLPPAEYIQKKKIEKARELLADTDLSVTEIAYRYGFSSGQYFATVFKRFCCVTPTQFRKNIRKENEWGAVALNNI